ncbi:MAG: urease accessory protein UreE [Desulfovibrio sp.]|nr:urease accessory protein UreE [Desulfovibrio sp.]
MLELIQNLGQRPDLKAGDTLSLDYENRCRARLRVRLDSGPEAGLFLKRGQVLAEGDILCSAEGHLVRALCKAEETVLALARDWPLLARGCYHLGNRHVPVQIGDLRLRFKPDAVLETMLRQLGFELQREDAPFTPEGGAYAQALHHDHAHDHGQGHDHGCEHIHVPDRGHAPDHAHCHEHPQQPKTD